MPAIANLSLKNPSGTEDTLVPRNKDPKTGVTSYVLQNDAFADRTLVTYSVSVPNTPTGRIKVRGKVSIAVMDPLDDTKKIDDSIGNFEFSFGQRATLNYRRYTRTYLMDLINDAITEAAVENFEDVY